MVETFACPECGEEVLLEGLAPGRLTPCEACGTLVEVPYLVRVNQAGLSTRRFRKKRDRRLLNKVIAGVIALFMVILVGVRLMKFVESKLGNEAKSRLNQVLADADASERSGRLDRALTEIEAAVKLASGDPRTSKKAALDALKKRRNEISLREATGRLKAIDSAEPAKAVGEAMTLRQRIKTDRALADLAPEVERALDSSRRRWFETEYAAARAGIVAGRFSESLANAKRAWTTAKDLNDVGFLTQVEAVVTEIARTRGVILEPIKGSFAFGSEEIYAKLLQNENLDAFQIHGYILTPQVPEWVSIWQAEAPNRFSIVISETTEGLYLQSQNRMTRIECRLRLNRRNAQSWDVVLNARTGQGPILTNMSAYQAGRIGTNSKRSPDEERILFDDAFKAMSEQFALRIRTMPDTPK